VPLRGCTLFGEGLPAEGTGQLQVDVAGALGDLRCGQGAGEVSFVEATLGSVTRRALCGQPLVFEVPGPATYQTLTLTGFEQSGDAGIGVPSVPDAAVSSPVVDAGLVGDGGADASADDASVGITPPPQFPEPDAGQAGMELRGVPRWTTRCFGQSLPGILSLAACEPFAPLP
jgi:hypothetical protein